MSIYTKLFDIQCNLKAPKNQTNSFGRYNYRSCEDILEALKPILSKVGAVILIKDDVTMIGDRYYVKATAKLIDTETNETIENTAFAREENDKKGQDASQLTGSTSSYARKYALNGLFAIDDTKDSDSTNQHGKGDAVETRTKTQTKAPDKQKVQSFDVNKMVKVLQMRAQAIGMDDADLLSFAKAEIDGLTKLEDMNREQGKALLTTMMTYPKKEVE